MPDVAVARVVGVTIGLIMLLSMVAGVQPAAAVVGGWLHVGTGPLAASTGAMVAVPYPSGITAGDLLLLSCQGRRNAMKWSAPGYTIIFSPNDDQGPLGPPGLRWGLQYLWATGTESGTLTVSNVTGVNGWSCAITAFRGGPGSGHPWASASYRTSPAKQTTMSTQEPVAPTPGGLVTHWFASSDNNSHGSNSDGTLAFGGTAYQTIVGTDHAASMSYHLDGPPASEFATMRQNANAPDSFIGITVVFIPGT